LDPSRKEYYAHIQELIKQDDDESNELLRGYVREAMRLNPQFTGLWRVSKVETAIPGTDITVKPGERIWGGFKKAHRNPADFPDPLVVNPKRDPKAYQLNGGGFHLCIGVDFAVQVIAETLKIVYGLNNVTRAPGESGKLATTTKIFNLVETNQYIKPDGTLSDWPVSMLISYDQARSPSRVQSTEPPLPSSRIGIIKVLKQDGSSLAGYAGRTPVPNGLPIVTQREEALRISYDPRNIDKPCKLRVADPRLKDCECIGFFGNGWRETPRSPNQHCRVSAMSESDGSAKLPPPASFKTESFRNESWIISKDSPSLRGVWSPISPEAGGFMANGRMGFIDFAPNQAAYIAAHGNVPILLEFEEVTD